MKRAVLAVFLCVAGASGASACDAAKARFAVGRTYSDALAGQARAKAGAATVRQMIRGRFYTMEFISLRLNLHTNRRGKVLSASCG